MSRYALTLLFIVLGLIGCDAPDEAEQSDVTEESAKAFIDRVNQESHSLWLEGAAASWVYTTYLNEDTAKLSSLADQRYGDWHSKTVAESLRYQNQNLDPTIRRAIDILALGTRMPAPARAEAQQELADIAVEMERLYSEGQYCSQDGSECLYGSDLEEMIATTRDYEKALEYWQAWRELSVPMRASYERFVELSNEGARELGYADLGQMWRSNYDMPEADFKAETDRLWGQVQPLYEALQCHVRAKLVEQYGADKVPVDGHLPAHLLGNMWAQNWSTIYDLVEPYPGAVATDVTTTLVAEGYSPEAMVRSAEGFYTSLGFEPLPDSFWERSMLSRPEGRDVVCHASAHDMDGGEDIRIKMCINQTYSDLRVIYHELGHNMYARAYGQQPTLFKSGANDGFHEAVGDAILLAMTPAYLDSIGLIDTAANTREATINDQMQRALEKVVQLPWTKLVDEWRWGVFAGDITPRNYNQSWWRPRREVPYSGQCTLQPLLPVQHPAIPVLPGIV
jgi:peptidyl-dipeptidase A